MSYNQPVVPTSQVLHASKPLVLMESVDGIVVSALPWDALITQSHYAQCIHHYVFRMDLLVSSKLTAPITPLKVPAILVVPIQCVPGLVLQSALRESV